MRPNEITIIGGGIAGLAAAIGLNNLGFKTRLFEAAAHISAVGAGLSLAPNAISALHYLGIKQAVLEKGYQLPQIRILDIEGKVINGIDHHWILDKYGIENFAIHRADLHSVLMSKIDPATIYTNKKIIGIKRKNNSCTLIFKDGSRHEAEYIIVADGIHSLIRQELIPGSTPRYSGYTCWRGIINDHGLNLRETTETWGYGKRFGIVPINKNQLYWFATMNAKAQDESLMKIKSPGDFRALFKGFHQDVQDVIGKINPESVLWNDILDIRPLKKYAYDRILLIGDAAHATTPNLGQGACQALEDAAVLTDALSKEMEIISAFQAYEKRRIAKATFVVNTSQQLGKIAQWENKLFCSLRNFILKMTPTQVNMKQFDKLYTVDF